MNECLVVLLSRTRSSLSVSDLPAKVFLDIQQGELMLDAVHSVVHHEGRRVFRLMSCLPISCEVCDSAGSHVQAVSSGIVHLLLMALITSPLTRMS